jgi:hypothetical protein
MPVATLTFKDSTAALAAARAEAGPVRAANISTATMWVHVRRTTVRKP